MPLDWPRSTRALLGKPLPADRGLGIFLALSLKMVGRGLRGTSTFRNIAFRESDGKILSQEATGEQRGIHLFSNEETGTSSGEQVGTHVLSGATAGRG